MAFALAGIALEEGLHLPLPGSIIGMALLFTLLATNLVPARWVESGARFLIRYMALLFIPASVGIMNNFDIIGQQALPILAGTLLSTVLVFVTLSVSLDRSRSNRGNQPVEAVKAGE